MLVEQIELVGRPVLHLELSIIPHEVTSKVKIPIEADPGIYITTGSKIKAPEHHVVFLVGVCLLLMLLLSQLGDPWVLDLLS